MEGIGEGEGVGTKIVCKLKKDCFLFKKKREEIFFFKKSLSFAMVFSFPSLLTGITIIHFFGVFVPLFCRLVFTNMSFVFNEKALH